MKNMENYKQCKICQIVFIRLSLVCRAWRVILADPTSAMQSLALLAAEPLNIESGADSEHIVNHYNGHYILKRLIVNDVNRIKEGQTGSQIAICSSQQNVDYLERLLKWGQTMSVFAMRKNSVSFEGSSITFYSVVYITRC